MRHFRRLSFSLHFCAVLRNYDQLSKSETTDAYFLYTISIQLAVKFRTLKLGPDAVNNLFLKGIPKNQQN